MYTAGGEAAAGTGEVAIWELGLLFRFQDL